MAKRSSGCVNVNIAWSDQREEYRAVVSSPEGRKVVWVGAPKHLTRAVDSPGAYDSAAHAAISFAGDASNHADWNDSGMKISRRAAPASCRKKR